jgi:hypothetical protein
LSSGDKREEEPSDEGILFPGLHCVTSDWTRESQVSGGLDVPTIMRIVAQCFDAVINNKYSSEEQDRSGKPSILPGGLAVNGPKWGCKAKSEDGSCGDLFQEREGEDRGILSGSLGAMACLYK